MAMDLEQYSLLRRILVFLLLILLALLMYALTLSAWNSSAELGAYDMLMRMRPALVPRPDIVILAIDSRATAEYGDLPWDRRQHARIINALRLTGARVIAYDVLFDEPDTAHPGADAVLRRAVRDAGNVYLPMAYDPLREADFSPADIRALILLERFAVARRLAYPAGAPDFRYYYFVTPLADLVNAAAGVGGKAGPAGDGVVRQAQTAYLTTVLYPVPDRALPRTMPLPKFTDRVVALQGLPLAVAAGALGGDKQTVQANLASAVTIVVDQTTVARIPVDEWGMSGINFAGPMGALPTYSAPDLLKGRLDKTLLTGKIVFVGVTDPAFPQSDYLETPYYQMPRVEVTANAVNTILDESSVVRTPRAALAALLVTGIILGLLLPVFSEWQLGFFSVLAPLIYILLAMLVLAMLSLALPVIPAVLLILLGTISASLLHPAMFLEYGTEQVAADSRV